MVIREGRLQLGETSSREKLSSYDPLRNPLAQSCNLIHVLTHLSQPSHQLVGALCSTVGQHKWIIYSRGEFRHSHSNVPVLDKIALSDSLQRQTDHYYHSRLENIQPDVEVDNVTRQDNSYESPPKDVYVQRRDLTCLDLLSSISFV